MLPHDLTIEVDDREKKPLRFPSTLEYLNTNHNVQSLSHIRVHTVSARFDAGDYRVMGYEHAAAVERKMGLTELYTNLFTRDRDRFERALRRLSESCQHPLLVVEASPAELSKPPRIPGIKVTPTAIRDRLMDVCLEFGVQLWTVSGASTPNRRLLGEWVAAFLLRSIRNVETKSQ